MEHIYLYYTKYDAERSMVTMRQRPFNFSDLIEKCRAPVDKAYHQYSPEVLESHMSQYLKGSVAPLSVVIYPKQYMSDVISRCPDDILCIYSKLSNTRSNREMVASKRIIFVTHDCVKNLASLFKQKVYVADNDLYPYIQKKMNSESIPAEYDRVIADLFRHCYSIWHLASLVPVKRQVVEGIIPQRVIYVCPGALGDSIIYGQTYTVIHMNGNTAVEGSRKKVMRLLGAGRNVLDSHQTQVKEIAVHMAKCRVYSLDTRVLIMFLPNQGIYQTIRILQKQDTVFCETNRINRFVQSDKDFHALLRLNDNAYFNQEIVDLQIQQTVVPDRAGDCLSAECPICFNAMYQDSLHGFVIPVFQWCCQKTICYRCLMHHMKNATHRVLCPLCRTDIDYVLTYKPKIIPLPADISTLPADLQQFVVQHKYVPRLYYYIIKSTLQLLQKPGIDRIAFLPSSQSVCVTISEYLRFLLLMHTLRDFGDVRRMFRSAFEYDIPDLAGFLATDQPIMLYQAKKCLFIANKNGIDSIDLCNIDAVVLFGESQLIDLMSMTNGSLFQSPKDMQDRLVYIYVQSVSTIVYESTY